MQSRISSQSNWLQSYYFTRALFSIAWISAAIVLSAKPPSVAFLLVIYPVWDALANLVDARVNGGLKVNPSQALNVVVSIVTALAVVVAAYNSTYAVLAVFGAWAILSGLLQLYTGVRRWRIYGAQWVMVPRHGRADDSRYHPLRGVRGLLFPAFRNLACGRGPSQSTCIGAA